MKNNDIFTRIIFLPELSLSFNSLKNHLKNIYKIDINMSNINYVALEKTNVWGLYSEDIRTIEEEGSFEANHWVFSKVGNEYEAVYDGLYMHVFGSLEDLMARQKEIAFYEYDADKSEENGEETFVDANGNEREYKEFAANGKKLESFKAPKGYKRLVSGKVGSVLQMNLIKNGVDTVEIPDPKIKGYVTIYIRREAKNIEKAKNVIGSKLAKAAANGTEVPEKIKVAFYKWGEYEEDEEIDLIDLPETILGEDELSGFNIREEDVDKIFYASDLDIDTDEDGTSVKRSYATNYVKAANGKKILNAYYKDKQSGEIFTEKEMLEAVDNEDNLDSFYLIGEFESKEEALKHHQNNKAANGVSLDDTLESIKAYDYRNQKTYVFSVGMHVKWIQAGRVLSGKIIAIRKPKQSTNNHSEWSVHVKSDVSGKTLYTKVYFLQNEYNKFAINDKLPFDEKNAERIAFIGELMAEGERINDEEDVMEMRADIADVNESTSEQKQFWVINSLIDFVQHSPKIDYFVKKAKDLGWADQYAANGKSIGKWRKIDSYTQQKAEDGIQTKRNEIADAILLHLGGMNRLNAMTGAYNFISLPNGLSFRIKNPAANFIKITITSMDLYDLEVGRIRGDRYTVVETKNGLYDNMLRPAIEEATGMYLSMGTMGRKAANGTMLGDKYKLGDMYSPDFDYGGMFDMVLKVNSDWTVEDLKKLKDSLVDVNYTSIAIALGAGISFMEAGDKTNANVVFNKVRHLMKKEMVEQYVDRYMNDDMSVIFDTIGMDMPVELEGDEYHQTMDDAREVATAYFMKHPEEMKNKFGEPYKFAKGGPVSDKIKDIDNSGTTELPDEVYFKGKRYIGRAGFINGFNGYTSSKDDGFLCAFTQEKGYDREKLSLWNDNIKPKPNYLTDKEGFKIMSKNYRGQSLTFEENGVRKFAKGGPVNVSDFEETETVTVDGKEYKVRLSYNLRLNSTNINVIDDSGYPWNIEKVPFQVMTKLHSMFDKLIHEYWYNNKTWKAADGAEIDALVNDWKAIKSVLSSPSSSEIDLEKVKILDIETNTVHNPVFIDFEEKIIIMENSEFGRSRNDFNKVKMFIEGEQKPSNTITKKVIDKVLSPAEIMRQKSNPVMGAPIIEETSTSTGVVKQPVITKVDPTAKSTIWPKVLQEMWAEAKGSGVVLISPENMDKIEGMLMSSNISGPVYRTMVDDISYWLDVNQVLLRSKPFMKKIRETLKNNPV